MEFPDPPRELLESYTPLFRAAPELNKWAFETFIDEASPLCNDDHVHLRGADILFLWTNAPNIESGKRIVGTAQIGMATGKGWSKARTKWLYSIWNKGEEPDFVITIDACYVAEANATSKCALIEHELYHCAQKLDKWGEPKFIDGMPQYTIKAHDVEEFVGVVRRYGAYSPELKQLVDAASKPPSIGREKSDFVCGCGARV